MAKRQKKSDGGIWETVKTIFWALLIAAVFRSLLFQPFSIPSGSMKPTLLVGDYLFVSKFAYGYSRYSFPFSPDLFEGRIWSAMPERGDVVVFKHPRHDACAEGPISWTVNLVKAVLGTSRPAPNDCVDYVKRVIGLPGDRIQVRGGILHINGQALPTEPVADFVEEKAVRGVPPGLPRCMNEPVGLGGECRKEQYIETLPGGRKHAILNVEGEMGNVRPITGRADDTREFVVPDGHLFFMGDNRDNSVDSRFPDVGTVPLENLIGRADLIAFSSDGPLWQVWNWRSDRFLKSIE
ncbi:signal peptidase I [Limibaculum sp. M0105]|uniref:Signal peptidase I n=1 Tax=Thermohalobaculum xanthum TaxID=2753746 RepID=A0A8J7M842_9RHOB|nr:signal peptidase I [Thermohalobaculum xanthum]MBK0400056.1 signal peptidase I [Thermohalobaculum xanthum]